MTFEKIVRKIRHIYFILFTFIAFSTSTQNSYSRDATSQSLGKNTPNEMQPSHETVSP